MANTVYVATRTMVVANADGKIYNLYAGNSYVEEGHELLTLAPNAFKPMRPTFRAEKAEPTVETATNRPGEKRSVTPPKTRQVPGKE